MFCIFCRKSSNCCSINAVNSQQTPQILGSQLNDYSSMIFPCLCNHSAHRECLKAYVIVTRKINCEKCKVTYALNGFTSKSLLKMNSTNLKFILMKVGLLIVLISIFALIIGLLTGSLNNEGAIPIKVVMIMSFSGVIFFLILLLVFIIWKNFFSKRIKEIMVFCKQTEIALHSENPEQIFQSFINYEYAKKSSQKIREAKNLFKIFDLNYYESCIKNRIKISGSISFIISFIKVKIIRSDASNHRKFKNKRYKKYY